MLGIGISGCGDISEQEGVSNSPIAVAHDEGEVGKPDPVIIALPESDLPIAVPVAPIDAPSAVGMPAVPVVPIFGPIGPGGGGGGGGGGGRSCPDCPELKGAKKILIAMMAMSALSIIASVKNAYIHQCQVAPFVIVPRTVILDLNVPKLPVLIINVLIRLFLTARFFLLLM